MSKNIAKRIKKLRKEKDLTLEQVANVVGVGKSTVRKWETGMIANMKQDKVPLLAKALGTTPEYIMGLDLQSQIESLAEEIDEIKKKLQIAYGAEKEEMEYALAVLEESYDDLLIAQALTANSEEEYKKISPDELVLTEGEKAWIKLLRRIPVEAQPVLFEKILSELDNLE